jgi:hypothetical protein
VASLDSQLHIANARLNETHAEVRSLMTKQSVQQNRIQELEHLLEATRAQHFSQSHLITAPEKKSQVHMLQVRFSFQHLYIFWLACHFSHFPSHRMLCHIFGLIHFNSSEHGLRTAKNSLQVPAMMNPIHTDKTAIYIAVVS